MKFNEYDKKENKKQDHKEATWVFDFDFAVSHLISEARLRKGLTQEELAILVGTKQPGIARVESGSSLPSLGFLKKIAIAIGADLVAPRFGFMEDVNQTSINIIYRVEERIKYFPVFIGTPGSITEEISGKIN